MDYLYINPQKKQVRGVGPIHSDKVKLPDELPFKEFKRPLLIQSAGQVVELAAYYPDISWGVLRPPHTECFDGRLETILDALTVIETSLDPQQFLVATAGDDRTSALVRSIGGDIYVLTREITDELTLTHLNRTGVYYDGYFHPIDESNRFPRLDGYITQARQKLQRLEELKAFLTDDHS